MINRFLSIVLLIVSSLVGFKTLAAEPTIKPFDATYNMYRQGDKLGEGKRSLTRLKDGNYTLELSSHIEWLIFSDTRKESSTFAYNNELITPISYHFERSGTGKDKELTITFNKDQSLVIDPQPKRTDTPESWQQGWLDEMSLHMQVQADLIAGKKSFEYNMISNSGKLRNYKLEVIGSEIISTGLGRFEAIKVSRVYDKQKFYAQHAWFIPELNYTLARMWRMKKGVEQYDLVIKEYKTK